MGGMLNINAQVSHLAQAVARLESKQGELPAQVEVKKVNAVTLRNGKELPEVVGKQTEEEPEVSEEVGMGSADEEELAQERETKKKAAEKGKEKLRHVEPIIPFPGRMAREQEKEELTELVKIFKKVEVNMPLLVALRSMPRCAKFLKELCTRKVKYTDDAKFQVGESVFTVLQRDMPIKCGDPGMFYIPCVIGTMKVDKAMLDVGASINVMPLSMYQDVEIGSLKPTRVGIQLADRSNLYPEGLLEDVLVKVEELIFAADFYILDMGKSKARDPVMLLGRPFLKTARARIDCDTGKLTCQFEGETVTFDIYNAMKHPADTEMVKSVDIISRVVEEKLPRTTLREPFDVRAPKLELKSLPKHLKYIFLGETDTLPVIINSELTPEDESKVKKTLGKYKEAIGWTLADIKGISPTVCMHHILLEEDATPVRNPHRKLNPAMKEVVMKEILKLLDLGIIYPVSDSRWVSPVHVVPKKSGIQVVENEFRELIATRLQIGWRIWVAKEDQGKTTFTCPFGTFAYRRMPFGLCNAPGTFQRCMMSIFSDLLKNCIEVFMDDFTVYGETFDSCLANLEKVLQRCVDKSLVLNYEKCHFKVESCDASGYAIGAVLGQKRGKESHVIYYASKTLNGAQISYSTTEKEMLAVVFAFEKFRSYLLGGKTTVDTDHAALKYLLAKKESKPRLIRWVLFLQEFDVEIKDKAGAQNQVADHLSRIVRKKEGEPIKEMFPDEQLFYAQGRREYRWYADLCNYLCSGYIPPGYTYAQKKKLTKESREYIWDEPYLWKQCGNQMLRRCIPQEEQGSILEFCHSKECGGHFGHKRTVAKVLECGFYWPTIFKDSYMALQELPSVPKRRKHNQKE
ncbi:uncharacterized protein LOC131003830 [Salvia miltiorrhiza]|uniref:uncharacterized protein LOC131003830 n=1 Tax=Salvia miltiorrhiza TaxID=226208 RepID=UPI0025ABC8AB|nr:uncharacterized protein LOC131003830 [Salvia miltiorrhiza]